MCQHHIQFMTISQLKPGHYILWDYDNGLKINEWWSTNNYFDIQDYNILDESKIIDELDSLLLDSVEKRLISDVPVGVFLSGGLDSSLIAAMSSKIRNKKIKTYSIGFNNKKYDESYYSSIVAEHIRSDHKIKYINHHDLLSVLDEFENNFDEPFSDSAAFPTLCISKFARKEVKVVLSGDGSDELFGGYDYYKIIEKIQLILNLPNFLKNLLHHALKIMPFHKLKLLSECIQKNNIIEVYSFMRSVSKDFYKISSDKNNNPFYELFLESYKKMPQKLSPQQYASRLDLLHTLGDGYLQKLDLSSMSFSLEAREPYLDKNVVEFALQLPFKFKISKHTSKYILKKVAHKYLPENIIHRSKKGFEVPISEWLKGPLKQWSLEIIENETLYHNLPINMNEIKKLFQAHLSGYRNVTPYLWNVIILLNFIQKRKNLT